MTGWRRWVRTMRPGSTAPRERCRPPPRIGRAARGSSRSRPRSTSSSPTAPPSTPWSAAKNKNNYFFSISRLDMWRARTAAMAGWIGIPRERWPVALALVLLLAFTLSWLQGRFDQSDAKKAIAAAMSWKPAGSRTVFDALASRGEGDPQCVGNVVSQLMGDVEVLCATPQKPLVEYQFRVLLDGRK